MISRLLTILLLAVFIIPAIANAEKLFPIDEGPQDSSFLAFRQQLQHAVAEKDTKFIYGILHPDIEYTFGYSQPTPEGFIDYWNLDNPDLASDFWDTFQLVLSMGGAFNNNSTFIAPYVVSSLHLSENQPDPWAIIDANVPVYQDTSSNSEILVRLSYEIVEMADDYWMYDPLYKIIFGGGKTGFIMSDKVYSPTGYRAYFYKQNNRWLMRYFIAGD